jgi:TolB protein
MHHFKVSLMLGALLQLAALPSTAFASTGEILFTSNRHGGSFELYRMAADGAQVRRITPERGEASDMSWSPDGSKVLYVARRDRKVDVYVTSTADGSTQRLTHDALPSAMPVWAPDGKTIAFVSMREGSRKIYLMAADGSQQRRLTQNDGDDEIAPRFSPDGKRLAYMAANEKVTPRVSVSDLQTGVARIVSNTPIGSFETPPTWSPDGQRLTFSVIKSGTGQIVSMRADGSDRRQLTQAEARHNSPQWSPDGKSILYTAVPADAMFQSIYVMDADGKNSRKVYGGAREVLTARWSERGERIVFVELSADGRKIFSVDTQGLLPQRLSDDSGADTGLEVCCNQARATLDR